MRVLLFAAVLLTPCIALGQGSAKQCVPDLENHCVQPLKEGEPAPFDGQLYTPELALDHAEKVHSFDERLKIELRRQRETYEAKLSLEKQQRAIDQEAAAAREEALEQALDDATPPFYERPAFVIPVTAVVVGGIVLAAVAISAEMGQAVWAR